MRLVLFVLLLIGSITIVSSQYVASQTPSLKFLSSSNFIDAQIIFMLLRKFKTLHQVF